MQGMSPLCAEIFFDQKEILSQVCRLTCTLQVCRSPPQLPTRTALLRTEPWISNVFNLWEGKFHLRLAGDREASDCEKEMSEAL